VSIRELHFSIPNANHQCPREPYLSPVVLAAAACYLRSSPAFGHGGHELAAHLARWQMMQMRLSLLGWLIAARLDGQGGLRFG